MLNGKLRILITKFIIVVCQSQCVMEFQNFPGNENKMKMFYYHVTKQCHLPCIQGEKHGMQFCPLLLWQKPANETSE